ncbi:MAG: amino acid permease [Bacteroidetes bacterium]|nr:amino acid permease [Bacteroidota bacterium]
MAGVFRKKLLSQLQTDTESNVAGKGLRKVLSVRDLTFMGIAAIIGAGIFSTIGSAAYQGGPGISILFIVTAITCGFSALCYAEFASRVPLAGSAYTYSYVVFGEIIAWIIGWALILEYSIGNIVVAISWSGYFNNLLVHLFHIELPSWMLVDPVTAAAAYKQAVVALSSADSFSPSQLESFRFAKEAFETAPKLGQTPLFFNLPAFIIVILVTYLAYVGIKESKQGTNLMVLFKVAVILFVIGAGAFYVDTNNWIPFMPNGISGVLKGVSAVFYAYIGFDAISTMAEECKNPQRDLPRGMINSLLICTVLYIAIALVLTGMEHYSLFGGVTDPLAFVFEKRAPWIEKIISISAVVATTSVLIVFQIGQPRIWMSMSRDGLLPSKFQSLNKYQTPGFATLITGLIVGVGALFLQSGLVTDLTSIGTLFAFVLVSGGVLLLPRIQKKPGQFTLPDWSGRYWIPAFYLVFLFLNKDRLELAFDSTLSGSPGGWLLIIYFLISLWIAILTAVKNLAFIPVMGVLSCLYLLVEIPITSWKWFFIWMVIGLVIYFLYGQKNSKLNAN